MVTLGKVLKRCEVVRALGEIHTSLTPFSMLPLFFTPPQSIAVTPTPMLVINTSQLIAVHFTLFLSPSQLKFKSLSLLLDLAYINPFLGSTNQIQSCIHKS